VLAAKNSCDATLHLGSADPPTVRELLMEVIRRAGSRSGLLPLPGRLAKAALWSLHAVRMAPLVPEQFRIADVDYVLDTTRAGEVLGWRARLSDADMLFSAYQTYIAGLEAPRGRHVAAARVVRYSTAPIVTPPHAPPVCSYRIPAAGIRVLLGTPACRSRRNRPLISQMAPAPRRPGIILRRRTPADGMSFAALFCWF